MRDIHVSCSRRNDATDSSKPRDINTSNHANTSIFPKWEQPGCAARKKKKGWPSVSPPTYTWGFLVNFKVCQFRVLFYESLQACHQVTHNSLTLITLKRKQWVLSSLFCFFFIIEAIFQVRPSESTSGLARKFFQPAKSRIYYNLYSKISWTRVIVALGGPVHKF